MLVKKKDLKLQEQKKLDVEKQALEKQMQDKEAEYQKTKGGKYMKRDDFKQYAANLRGKNTEYKKKKQQLAEIKTEVNVLNRTKSILQGRCDNLAEFMQDLEKTKGITGYANVEEQI
jgi:intraflagellar transport protein 81